MGIDTLSGIGHSWPSQYAIPASELKWYFATKGYPWCSPAVADGGVVSSPVVDHGAVYFGGLDGKLYAVSTAV